MGSDLEHPFAIYPMVEEGEASGAVAAIYGAMLERFPFVPSLFKSLAVCPPYLVMAWRQAEAVLDDLARPAAALVDHVRAAATPPPDGATRELLARFVGPLGRMLLVSAGLLAALDGELDGETASAEPSASGRVEPSARAPSQWEVDAAPTFGRIRLALDTPIINSIWRVAAAEDVLDHAWEHLEPQAVTTRSVATELQHVAVGRAAELSWPVVADRAAMGRARIDDAAPGMATILDAYVKTLPRVLALVASSDAGSETGPTDAG